MRTNEAHLVDVKLSDVALLVDKQLEEVTPEIIAELFANMGSDGQARFFNHVDKVASCWAGGGLPFQLQAVTDDDGLTLAGRRVMQMIGDYSPWGAVQ